VRTRRVGDDLVVHAGPRAGGGFRSEADADGLDCRNRHHRLRQAAVEFAIPLDVAAEPHRHTGDDDFEASAFGVTRVASLIDFRDHALFDLWIHTAQRRIGGQCVRLRKGHHDAVGQP
jgi:hypothetical protein